MLIFTTIVSAVLFNKVYIFQTNPYFDTIRKGTMN